MNVGVIGAGGIGSYLAEHLDRLIELGQIKKMNFTFFDDDVVEIKNMLYQNFSEGDIDSFKSEALSLKYFNLNFKNKRLKEEDLLEFDLVVLCADNNIIRRAAYHAFCEKDIEFIDSRANGRSIGIFSSDTENYLKTIDNSSESMSCQNPFQIANKEIEYGNVVIAAYLAQCILNYDRKESLPSDFMIRI